MGEKVVLTKFWSDSLQLTTHFGIKLYYNNPNSEDRIIDFNDRNTKEIFGRSKIKSPYVFRVSNNVSYVNCRFFLKNPMTMMFKLSMNYGH